MIKVTGIFKDKPDSNLAFIDPWLVVDYSSLPFGQVEAYAHLWIKEGPRNRDKGNIFSETYRADQLTGAGDNPNDAIINIIQEKVIEKFHAINPTCEFTVISPPENFLSNG